MRGGRRRGLAARIFRNRVNRHLTGLDSQISGQTPWKCFTLGATMFQTIPGSSIETGESLVTALSSRGTNQKGSWRCLVVFVNDVFAAESIGGITGRFVGIVITTSRGEFISPRGLRDARTNRRGSLIGYWGVDLWGASR
jgi:hypothetical protein